MTRPTLLLLAAVGALAGCTTLGLSRGSSTPRPAPDSFTVAMETSKGPVTMIIRRHWAPIGVDRLHHLIEQRYYDQARFFRIEPGFVVQWGLAADSAKTAMFKAQPLQDDPVVASNTRGMISFARSGRNSRTAQLFINLGDNARLDLDSGFGFPPIGEVLTGLEVVEAFTAEYRSMRPTISQDSITRQGNAYLARHYPNLDWIKTMRVTKRWK